MLGDHGDVAKSKPWEGSAHVPLMCSGPGIVAGQTVNLPVAQMDMAGTFMDYAGATPAPGTVLTSALQMRRSHLPLAPGMTTHSLRPFLEGKDTTGSSYRKFVSSGLDNFRMVVQNINGSSYKYICCNGKCPNPPSTAPNVSASGFMQMLIDVNADPYDMHDLVPTHPEIVDSLRPLLPPTYAEGCSLT